MKKYLVHCVTDLMKPKNIENIEKKRNANIGSMFHQYALCNAISTEDTSIHFANFYGRVRKYEEFATAVNEKIDCIVFSLGDFFRLDWFERNNGETLHNMNEFIKRLKIKALVVGIGCKVPNNMSVKEFADTGMGDIIKEFMTNVLKHTNIVGIRGYSTAEVLDYLGFIRDKDYYICGCPSFFIHGNKMMIPNKFPKIGKTSNIIVNRNLNIIENTDTDNCHLFFDRLYKKYKNSHTLNTFICEYLNMLYKCDDYGQTSLYTYKNIKKMKYINYYSVEDWLDELSNYNICIGERMHGCAAAFCTGLPTITICVDSRMRELCEYHKLPYVNREDIPSDIDIDWFLKNCKYTLQDTINEYSKNFNKFINFFKINNIEVSKDWINGTATPFRKLLCNKYKKEIDVNFDFPSSFFIDEFKNGHYVSSKKKQVWAIELDILNNVKTLCEKHNIKYYIDAGTLLGAIRHKGFIPWDDDIDIVMFPEDYKKFRNVADKELPMYYFQDYTTDCRLACLKIGKENTTFITHDINEATYKIKEGIAIDVSILNNVPDDEDEYQNMLKYLKLMRQEILPKMRRYYLYEPNNEALKQSSIFLREKYNNLINKYHDIDTNSIAVIGNATANQELRKYKNEFSETLSLKFEMLQLPSPIGYDSILKRLYGDYMLLKKNGAQHNRPYIDINNSYSKYKNAGN